MIRRHINQCLQHSCTNFNCSFSRHKTSHITSFAISPRFLCDRKRPSRRPLETHIISAFSYLASTPILTNLVELSPGLPDDLGTGVLSLTRKSRVLRLLKPPNMSPQRAIYSNSFSAQKVGTNYYLYLLLVRC